MSSPLRHKRLDEDSMGLALVDSEGTEGLKLRRFSPFCLVLLTKTPPDVWPSAWGLVFSFCSPHGTGSPQFPRQDFHCSVLVSQWRRMRAPWMLFSSSSLLLMASALCLIHRVDFDKTRRGNGLYNTARFMICLFSKRCRAWRGRWREWVKNRRKEEKGRTVCGMEKTLSAQ